jgi:hypothetical protein
MTHQQIFDQVARHLLTQKRKSVKTPETLTGRCLYRGPDGMKCAIGVLIPDEEYVEAMESLSISQLLNEQIPHNKGFDLQPILPLLKARFEDVDPPFLNALQNLHDGCFVENWKKELRGFAVDHGLNSTVLKEFP